MKTASVYLEEMFKVKGPGIVPGREELVMHYERPALEQKIMMLTGTQEEAENLAYVLGIMDSKDWSYEEARQRLLDSVQEVENIMARIMVRPFEYRWIAFHEALVESPQTGVMKHLLQDDNRALIAGITKDGRPAVFFSESIGTLDALTAETWYFPYNILQEGGTTSNINEERMKLLAAMGLDSQEKVIFYIYGMAYGGGLKPDGSRIILPLLQDQILVEKVIELGERLLCIHNLEEHCQISRKVKFFGDGKRAVVSPKYEEEEKALWINESQWFQPVTPEVWKYRIGDYQVLKELVRSREGQKLDPYHFVITITALEGTLALEKELRALLSGAI